ncbi:MAG: type II toxin-antitoxin system RelE/ParE family toxin [Bauldia sp.]
MIEEALAGGVYRQCEISAAYWRDPVAKRVYSVINSFRSKALRQFWEEGNRRGLRPDLVERISDLLDILDQAGSPEDTNMRGARFHGLRGKPPRFAVSVNKNWRITFGWSEGHAVAVDLEDYH